MKNGPQLNVLYLEPDDRTRSGLADKLKVFFAMMKLDANVSFANTAREVTLEGCIRVFWKWMADSRTVAETFTDCLEQELKIAAGKFDDLPDDGGWRLIATARRHFLSSSKGNELGMSFHYGLAYYAFRLLRIEDISDQVRARILATAYAAANKYYSLARA